MSRVDRIALRLIGERVTRSLESVRSVTASERNRFRRALDDLDRLSRAAKIPIALVGGMAAVHYGFRGSTEDIDIAVGKDDLDKFLLYAPQFGFKVAWRSKSGWSTLEHGDVEINVVPEGGKSKNTSPTTIPGPRQMGVSEGLGVACLSALMELKVAAGRVKDYGHIVELLKRIPADQIPPCRLHLEGVHPEYLRQFDQLIQQAEEEKAQEGDRGGVRR
jgi:hypothetical protein